MKIIGIDTGQTMGVAVLESDNNQITLDLMQFTDINKVDDFLQEEMPDIIIMEKIVSYGLGIDEAVLRAATDIGYFCKIGNIITAECIMVNKAGWLYSLYGSRKKLTPAELKKRIMELFGISEENKPKEHEACAAGLVYWYLNEQEKKRKKNEDRENKKKQKKEKNAK